MTKRTLRVAALIYSQRARNIVEQQMHAIIEDRPAQRIDLYPPTKPELELIEEAFVELEKETTKKVIHEALVILNPYIDQLGAKNKFKPNKEQKAAEQMLSEVSNKLRTLGGYIQPGQKEGV